jgi:hypothetical protein
VPSTHSTDGSRSSSSAIELIVALRNQVRDQGKQRPPVHAGGFFLLAKRKPRPGAGVRTGRWHRLLVLNKTTLGNDVSAKRKRITLIS